MGDRGTHRGRDAGALPDRSAGDVRGRLRGLRWVDVRHDRGSCSHRGDRRPRAARAPQPQPCRRGGAARGACRRACRPQLGASRGGRRQSRQEPLPRDGQPRNPHAAQRHSRHDRAPARYAAAARTGHLREGRADVRRDVALADRGDSRFLQSRGRQARPRAPTLQPRRAGRGNGRAAWPPRAGQGAGDRLVDRRQAARDGDRRCRRGCARCCSISPATP